MQGISTTPDFTAIKARQQATVHRAFEALDNSRRHAFHEVLTALARDWNRSERGTLVVPGEYLEAAITRS